MYKQVRAALANEDVQKYIDGDEYGRIAPEDRLGALVGKVRELGLKIDNDNLKGIYKGLPKSIRLKLKFKYINI